MEPIDYIRSFLRENPQAIPKDAESLKFAANRLRRALRGDQIVWLLTLTEATVYVLNNGSGGNLRLLEALEKAEEGFVVAFLVEVGANRQNSLSGTVHVLAAPEEVRHLCATIQTVFEVLRGKVYVLDSGLERKLVKRADNGTWQCEPMAHLGWRNLKGRRLEHRDAEAILRQLDKVANAA